MSLLLEALKKAERAKEEAQRRARAEGSEQGAAAPFEPERKPVLTRDKLPDIATTPLEIMSDDLSPPPPPKPAVRPEPMLEPLESQPPPKPAARKPAAAKPAADEQAASRASAKKVFEAKFREPNPRMPFYIAMGALGVLAFGTVGYFWYQLRPPPALVNLNPQRQAESPTVADASTPAAGPAAVPAAAPGTIPGLPPTAPSTATSNAPIASAPAAAATPAPRAAPVEPAAETPRPRPSQRIAEVQPAPAAAARAPSASVTRNPPQVNPRVEAGYEAYTSGDLATARSEYEQALRDEPANRDALLGLAAIDVRSGRYESAEALYMRVLQIDPRDSQAQAALISLRSGRSDPLATESRVKSLLAADPSAHALNFALGNQLAQQNRWAEAQQEYFKAYTAEPENADFAYNLAVSLDHLRQPRQALDYYQRAIGLSQKRGASFDLAAAKVRAGELAR
ncbi:MAG TPA: tetratricopeptide repeat protein [Burkholderiales bacterium]|nr:tetratricopeptide repeat protein [Burkholderiales bacterium]